MEDGLRGSIRPARWAARPPARGRQRFCVIGGQGVNACAEPVVGLEVDLVVVTAVLDSIEMALREEFTVERFPHRVNISDRGSDTAWQFQLDPRYQSFIDRAAEREVLGLRMPIAAIDDVLQGKVWAALDGERRPSKRQKDLADIARLLEVDPALRIHVPPAILERLL